MGASEGCARADGLAVFPEFVDVGVGHCGEEGSDGCVGDYAYATCFRDGVGVVSDRDVVGAVEVVGPLEDAGAFCDGGEAGWEDAIDGEVYSKRGMGEVCECEKDGVIFLKLLG